jgi:hypothetical protein
MGLEQFMYRAGEILSKQRGLLLLAKTLGAFQTDQITVKVWTCVGELLADAHKYGRIRPDIQVTDVNLALWSMAEIMQASKDVAQTVHPALEHHLQRPGGPDELSQALTSHCRGQTDKELGKYEADGVVIGGQTDVEADRHLQSPAPARSPDRRDVDRG